MRCAEKTQDHIQKYDVKQHRKQLKYRADKQYNMRIKSDNRHITVKLGDILALSCFEMHISPHYFHILHIIHKWKVKVLVTQSHPALSDPMDYSPPGSSVHGIFQAWILEWVPVSFSRGPSWPRDRTWVSCIAGSFFTVWATREANCPQNTTRKTVQLPNHLLFKILRSSVIELQMFVQKQCGI